MRYRLFVIGVLLLGAILACDGTPTPTLVGTPTIPPLPPLPLTVEATATLAIDIQGCDLSRVEVESMSILPCMSAEWLGQQCLYLWGSIDGEAVFQHDVPLDPVVQEWIDQELCKVLLSLPE